MPSRRPAFAAIVVAIALASCGGDEESGDTSTSPETTAEAPEATQPLSEQVANFEQALDSLDCEDAIEVVHPVVLKDPDDPSSPVNCHKAVNAIRAEKGVLVFDSQELGTGGILDTKFRGNNETLVWALDASGRFKYTASYISRDAQVGTEPDPDVDFQGVADDFVDALRAGDCKAAYPLLAQGTRLQYGSEKTFCDLFEANYTDQPEGLGSRLQEDPEAAPVLLDATSDIAVFGLSTEPAGYRTMVLATPGTGADPLVVDVLPTER